MHADPDDKWPARGLDELRYQFRVVAEEGEPEEEIVKNLEWEPLDPNLKAFEADVKRLVGVGYARTDDASR